MKTGLRTFLRKTARRFGLRKNSFPRIIVVDNIPPNTCQFEVTNPFEAGRVKAVNREKEFLARLLSELTSSDVFFDIGAGIGMFSIHAAAAARCQVVSFEPDPSIRSRLLHNLSLNSLGAFEMRKGYRHPLIEPQTPPSSHTPALQIVPWGVSNTQSQATLFTDGIQGNSPSLAQVHGLQHTVTIELKSLDHALATGEIPFPTLVKIDIEGAEVLAFQGMAGLLSSEKTPRLIFIELHPQFLPSFNTSTQEFYELMAFHHYQETLRAQRGAESHHIIKRIE